MVAFLAFLAGPIGRWLVIGLLVTVAVAGVYHRIKMVGWHERDLVAVEEEQERDRQTQALIDRQAAKLATYKSELDAKLAVANARVLELEGKLKVLYATLKGQVPVYVTPIADARIAACGGIPVGFVLLHNRAADGLAAAGPFPPAPEGGIVDRDSGVKLSEVEQAVVENYERFHRCTTALKAWEEWYPIVKETYERNLQ